MKALLKTPIMLTTLILVGALLLIVIGVNLVSSSTAAATPAPQGSASYLAAVNQRAALARYPDATLTQDAHAACMYLHDGYTEPQVITAVEGWLSVGPFDAGYLVGAAEVTYCPQYA